MREKILLIYVILVVFTFSTSAKDKFKEKFVVKEKDMMRKSIVFDRKTPDVFYCPMQKPSKIDKLIVRARPLYKLCEYEGKPLSKEYKSDCYQDIDETDYACKEKYRIMMRKYPPGSDTPYNGTRLKRFLKVENEVLLQMENLLNQ